MNPVFPYSYPPGGYTGAYLVTVKQQLAKTTCSRLNGEVCRRFVGLQLFLYERYGVQLGIGTGWRVQPANSANHAQPGNSYHEGMPVEAQVNAFAIDTVGLPTHEAAWSCMEAHLHDFGFTSFVIPQIRANWNYQNRAYNGNWDRPHIQPYEVPYSRSFLNDPRKLPTWPFPKWAIPQRYDLNYLNIDDPLPPVVVPQPPTGDDEEVLVQFARSINPQLGPGEVYAVYSNGTKIWQINDGTLDRARDLAALGGKDASIHDYPDMTLFGALGQVIGLNAPGHDAWGNKVS